MVAEEDHMTKKKKQCTDRFFWSADDNML